VGASQMRQDHERHAEVSQHLTRALWAIVMDALLHE
jgi:hypothetical protein